MNKLYCFIGFTLFLSSFFMNFLKNEKVFNNFMNLLNDKQKKIYNKIIKERLFIYISGTILGIIISLFLRYKYSYNICICLSIMLITKLVFYYIYPKSTYMMYHLTNTKQTDAWMDIYTHMKYNWIKSIILGLISYTFILNSIN